MSASQDLDVDRLREKFPRSYKALFELYPFYWDRLLGVIEEAMESGRTASVIAGKLSILRGLDRVTRKWVVLSIQADRREILYRGQTSFLTQLHDRSLDDILAELKDLESQRAAGRATPRPPGEEAPRDFTFISHHNKSAGKFAESLAEGVEQLGGACWVAPRDIKPGSLWNDQVYGAAQRCRSMVFLYSPDAARSRHAAGEVHIAVGRGVPIFVVKLSAGDPAAIDVGLGTYHHLDWIGREGSDDLPSLAAKLHDLIRQGLPRAA